MTLQERFSLFVENVGSNWIEVSSKSASFQCMDLAYLWVFVLNFPKATIQNAYAYQVYTNPKEITKKYFELIKNTPEFVPQVGDLVVWDKKYNGTAGHIAIAIGWGDTKKFKSFDQNVGSLYPQIIEHDYKHVLGVLRPMNQETKDVMLSELQIRYAQLQTKYDKDIKALNKTNNDKNAEINSLREQLNNLQDDTKEELEDMKKTIETLQAEVSKKQLEINDLAKVNEALLEETKLWNAFKNAVISFKDKYVSKI